MNWASVSILNVTEPVTFYEPEFYPLSNFSSFIVDWKGRKWMTAEHAYQAEKFSEPRSRHVESRIAQAWSAHDAKKIAHEFEKYIRPDWQGVQLDCMKQVLRAKLAQHSYVRKKLLETGDRLIVEDSPKDSFWGWGHNRNGHNHLGHIWMKLREELRNAPRQP